MKTTLILFLLITFFSTAQSNEGKFYGAAQEEMPKWFKDSFLDLSDDVDEATEKNKFIIIYFHQNGCPYCAKLIRDNFHNPALVKKIRSNFEVVAINMFGDKNITDWNGEEFSEKTFAQHLKIQFTPSLLFLDTNKKVVLRLNGYQSTQKMNLALDYIITNNHQKQSFANFKYQKSNKKIGKLNATDFFDSPPFILSRNKNMPASDYLAVFFEKPHCSDCDVFHQKLLQNKTVQQAFKKMQVIQLNALSNKKLIKPNGKISTAKDWYSELDLTYFPAIVFFDKTGKEIIRKDAFFKTFHFEAILSYVLDKAYLTQPSFQRYIEEKSAHIRKQGNNVDIWK